MITRTTTPEQVFYSAFPLNEVMDFIITYTQNGNIILNKQPTDCIVDTTANTISIRLSQEETKLFTYNAKDINKNMIEIQLKILTNDNIVMASTIVKQRVEKILNDDFMGE